MYCNDKNPQVHCNTQKRESERKMKRRNGGKKKEGRRKNYLPLLGLIIIPTLYHEKNMYT